MESIGRVTGSLHRYITFTIDSIADRLINHDAHQQGGKWSWKKCDQKKLQKFLSENEFPLANKNAVDITSMLDSYISKPVTPNGTYKENKRPAY